MAAKVNVSNVEVLDNPAPFDREFQFQITFECHEELPHDLEWKLTYVGSAESETHDQILDTVLVGPVPEGRHKFVFQADPPEASKIPSSELVGVTVVLLSCAYKDREFLKIGYFVRHEYDDEELRENPPDKPIIDKLTRYILAEEPRVTRINIRWGDEDEPVAQEGEEASSSTTTTGFGAANENVDPAKVHFLPFSWRLYESESLKEESTEKSSPVENGSALPEATTS